MLVRDIVKFSFIYSKLKKNRNWEIVFTLGLGGKTLLSDFFIYSGLKILFFFCFLWFNSIIFTEHEYNAYSAKYLIFLAKSHYEIVWKN